MFSTTPNFLCSICYGKSFFHHWLSIADATKKQGVGTAIRPENICKSELFLNVTRRMFSTTPNFLCSICYGKSFFHHWLSIADATKKQGVGTAIRPENICKSELFLNVTRRMFSTTPNFLCSICYGKSFFHHWLSVVDAAKKQGVGTAIRPENICKSELFINVTRRMFSTTPYGVAFATF